MKILDVILIVAIIILGNLIFHIPNFKYEGILNVTGYMFFCMIVIFIYYILAELFILNGLSRFKKTINAVIIICLVFTIVGIFYYQNLPTYTYEEAAEYVAEQIRQANPEKEITLIIPEHLEDQKALSEKEFLQTTHYIYSIYLDIDGETVSYRYEPLTHFFAVSDRTIENAF